ncbi:MAG: M20 family metallopeptidase [Gemmatimonadales bacterium]
MRELLDRVIAIRRDLHRHPELAWQEYRTAERIEHALEDMEIAHRRVAETGVVAELPGEGSGPCVALRADIDALPITEETGLPFASENEGVMHACGHDGHTAMLLGAAELLRDGDLARPARLLFQPAEERGTGASAMIEAGALENVAVIFGMHLDRNYPLGTLVIAEGPVNASTDGFAITVEGQDAHAARPQEGIDAVVVGSAIVGALQTITSREINPADPAVVTVGRFEAGTAGNVIARRAKLEGTLRAQTGDMRERLQEAVRRIADSVARAHRADVTVEFLEGTPPVVNSAEMVALAREAARRIEGATVLQQLAYANMGAEDFGFYLERVEGCYIRLGGGFTDRESPPAHSSRFDFDERALAFGAQWLAEVARVAGARLSDG